MDMELLVKQITKEVMAQISNSNEDKGGKTPNHMEQKTSFMVNSVITGPQVARLIDHTLLKPDSTKEQIIKLCEEAKEYQFATVCVNPFWVSTAAKELKGSKVGITTVVGFPLGATSTFTKISEARDAIASGATEIDMVINIGALKSGEYELVKKDIEGVVLACKGQAAVKVIIETGYLTEEEKKKACMLSKMAGADFVKTSTGFGPGCATPEDIALMREAVGPEMGVKASACVRDLDTARKMIAAGATRIGASAGIAIVKGEKGKGSY
ncbi:deoxyribose-phosphate aldolase [Bacillus carboniphilus]|uniref:Deoxyribose-phosphate aldolase n=2 Tax=Bacillus carboniphilus TaxID=86663 RepID=A0ABN0WGY3_9BACI